jgi:SAM-dependent methyltransferase
MEALADFFAVTTAVGEGCACQLCGAPSLREYPAFRALPRVTSDAFSWPAGGRIAVCAECGMVQKVADGAWQAEAAEIYARYALYHQSRGAEQPIFCENIQQPAPRSALIDVHIASRLKVPEDARVLDFGCGNGAALRTFSERHPNWRLHGAEIGDTARESLSALPNFVGLHDARTPERIRQRFDLVTLIHSLEHIVTPGALLEKLKRMLGDGGSLFVQVPDCAVTPFDLVIADHLSHFTLATLQALCARAGYETLAASNTVLPKELSWIGRPAQAAPHQMAQEAVADVIARVEKQIVWLEAQVTAARALAKLSQRFGIFGTSIAGTWLAGAVGEGIAFFVDEDPGRVGGEHLGAPVYLPKSIPSGSDVFVPLVPKTAVAIGARLSRTGVIFHVPPEIL